MTSQTMDFFEILVQYGALGAIAAWFMLRFEPKMDKLTDAVNRLAIAHEQHAA